MCITRAELEKKIEELRSLKALKEETENELKALVSEARNIWKNTRRKHRSAVTREMLYKQYDGRCQLCGKKLTLDNMTLDHIVPLNLGGADELENIQIACFACNQLKKNILPEDFLNRVTNVFMYQMEKKCKHNLQWKCIKRLLKTLG